jgi:hypothetical protein
VPLSTETRKEQLRTNTPEASPGVLVVRRHRLLVRCSHWLNVPILLGLILSGISIYWASPVAREQQRMAREVALHGESEREDISALSQDARKPGISIVVFLLSPKMQSKAGAAAFLS